MINIKNYKNLKSINRDFEIISNYFKKNLGKYWWFLNFSRLDLAPLGIPTKEKYYIKLKYFILIYCSLIKFILVKTFFSKKIPKLKNKRIFIFEEIKLNINLLKYEDYYFKDIAKKTKLNFINVIIGFKIFNDKKSYSIFQLTSNKDIFKIFLKSFFIYIKFYLIKNKILNKTENIKFWNNYTKKNSFTNFFLSLLTHNYFKNFDHITNTIIYPYEEKPFERAINFNKNLNQKKFIYAYLINPRDNLALYFNRYKKLRIPRPINYLFSGRIISERFKKIKRNNFLDNKNSIVGLSKGFKKKINFTHKNVFLVLISHPSETKLIFKWLSKIPNKNYYFIFRFPPSVKKKKFINIINNEKNFTISNNNRLIDDCRKSKYAIFSNTSAGLEAVNLGLVSIRIKTYNVNTSPLEKNHEKNFFCSSNFEDFKKNFYNLIKFNKKVYIKVHNSQYKITKDMYSEFSPLNFKKAILNKNIYV